MRRPTAYDRVLAGADRIREENKKRPNFQNTIRQVNPKIENLFIKAAKMMMSLPEEKR